MNRIILIESSGGRRKLIGLNLEIYVGAEVIYKRNADGVINFLKEDPNVQMVVAEEAVDDERTALKIFYYINSNSLKIPMILLGREDQLAGKVEMYYKSDWRRIIPRVANILEVTARDMVKKEVPKYYPISARMLLSMSKAPVDIYSQKLGKKSKLLFEQTEAIDKKIVREFIIKDDDYLFVRAEERVKFTEEFSGQILEYLKNEQVSVEDRVNATSLAFASAQEMIEQSGISERAINFAQATINSIVKVAASSHGLSDLLDILYESGDSYLYRHCLLISTLSHHVVSNIGWGNEEQKQKLVFAAFFHDITIPEEHLCRIHSNGELERASLSEKERKSVMNHALNASELIKKFPDIPFGVDSIVLQHHGALNGIGFKQHSQDSRVSTMAALFLVIEEYVDYMMNMDREFFKHDKVVAKLRRSYTKGNYRKVVVALEDLES